MLWNYGIARGYSHLSRTRCWEIFSLKWKLEMAAGTLRRTTEDVGFRHHHLRRIHVDGECGELTSGGQGVRNFRRRRGTGEGTGPHHAAWK